MTAIVSSSFNPDMWSTQKSRSVVIPSNQLWTPEDSPVYSSTMASYHASIPVWSSCDPTVAGGCSTAALGSYSPSEFNLSEPSPVIDELAYNLSNFDDFDLGESFQNMDALRANGPDGLYLESTQCGPMFYGVPEEQFYPMPQTLANGQFAMHTSAFQNQQRDEAPSPTFSSASMSRGNSAISYVSMQSNSPRSHMMQSVPSNQSYINPTLATNDYKDLRTKQSGRRRRNLPDNSNKARQDPLYRATPGADGLYHCPFEGKCTHKPEKLKCNYDKCVDSHLKPYFCKHPNCQESRFSSTACLLRHEREAHAMHGHGERPFACELQGCDRSFSGNGFPRHWNLRDHMRRVHNIETKPRFPEAKRRSRKRKAGPAA